MPAQALPRTPAGAIQPRSPVSKKPSPARGFQGFRVLGLQGLKRTPQLIGFKSDLASRFSALPVPSVACRVFRSPVGCPFGPHARRRKTAEVPGVDEAVAHGRRMGVGVWAWAYGRGRMGVGVWAYGRMGVGRGRVGGTHLVMTLTRRKPLQHIPHARGSILFGPF